MNPLAHYYVYGAAEGRDPHPLFDTDWYLSQNPDVAGSQINPIFHYLSYGAAEGRNPCALFQTSFYLSRYPDVAQSGMNPLIHYYDYGAAEGRDPNPLFDTDWYLSQNPDVAVLGMNPLAHYALIGARQGRDPNPLFDSDWYLDNNPDVAASGVNPLAHYISEGASQGRNACSLFDTRSYLGKLQVQAANIDQPSAPQAWPQSAAGKNDQRSAVRALIGRLSAANPTPYYGLLDRTTEHCSPEMLPHIAHTLNVIDVGWSGAVPVGRPLVSVIMPVYNRRDLVREAIGSVLHQSYQNLELLICDDGSSDDSVEVLKSFNDPRIKLFFLEGNRGAAHARNRCLEAAKGIYFAYLDSDNVWHPHYLSVMVEALMSAPGQPVAFCSYFDVDVQDGSYRLRPIRYREFSYELQLASPFVDLNSMMHHRALYDLLGGFDERLRRRQDYDLIARYAWCRDPKHVSYALNIYRRISGIAQISAYEMPTDTSIQIIDEKIKGYYRDGLRAPMPQWVKKISVLSWDMSRNHFAKAYSVAEALAETIDVELVSFQFFDEPRFAPLADRVLPFEMKCFRGGAFPEFFKELCGALDAITGDIVYAIKPRLTSFGLAMLVNRRRGTPIIVEVNDLETALEPPKAGASQRTVDPSALLARLGEAKTPYAMVWSEFLDPMVLELPLFVTHNQNLNRRYGSRGLFLRNVKDESIFDPSLYDRNALRREFGLADDDKMVLFGGLVREHKGIFELARFLEIRNEQKYKLFVVGSGETPELLRMRRESRGIVTIFPPQSPEKMAAFNLAADVVVLWLDPRAAMSHFQMPYKLTDAIAMGTPVVASPVSDFSHLGHIVWHVPFGDREALALTLERIFGDEEERTRRCEAGRRLFNKEFTYRSVRTNVALACALIGPGPMTLPVSSAFAAFFSDFARTLGWDWSGS